MKPMAGIQTVPEASGVFLDPAHVKLYGLRSEEIRRLPKEVLVLTERGRPDLDQTISTQRICVYASKIGGCQSSRARSRQSSPKKSFVV